MPDFISECRRRLWRSGRGNNNGGLWGRPKIMDMDVDIETDILTKAGRNSSFHIRKRIDFVLVLRAGGPRGRAKRNAPRVH